MKKILCYVTFVLAFISFNSFAEEKKVTEEMLLGEWECEESLQEAVLDKGKFQDFGDTMISEYDYFITKRNGQLFWGEDDEENALLPFDLEDIYKRPEYVVDDKQISQKIEYLSEDSFVMTNIYTTIDKKNNPIKKIKMVLTCDRVEE